MENKNAKRLMVCLAAVTAMTANVALAAADSEKCIPKSVLSFEEISGWYGSLESGITTDSIIGGYLNDALVRSWGPRDSSIVQSIEQNAEQTKITIRLNEKCKWSNGQPITSADVKAGLETVFNPEAANSIPRDGIFPEGDLVYAGEKPASALGMETPDDWTVQFPSEIGPEALRRALTFNAFVPLPAWRVKEKANYAFEGAVPKEFSGPYKVAYFHSKTDKNGPIIGLEANPFFCGPVPEIKHAEIVGVEGTEDFVNYAAQHSDVVMFSPSGSEELTKDVLQIDWIKGEFELLEFINSHVATMRFNVSKGPLIEHDLRKSLILALDWKGKTGLEARLVGPETRRGIAHSLVPIEYMPNAPEFNYDTRERSKRLSDARAMMKAQGYDDENPLMLTVAYASYQADIVFASLEMMEAGLPVKFETTAIDDMGEYYGSVYISDSTDFDLSFAEWGNIEPWPSQYVSFYYNNNILSPELITKGQEFMNKIQVALLQSEAEAVEREAIQYLIDQDIFIPFFGLGAVDLRNRNLESIWNDMSNMRIYGVREIQPLMCDS